MNEEQHNASEQETPSTPPQPERKLTSAEKREQMKEAYKKELRARKEFREKVQHLRRTQQINKALENMNYEDDSDDWIDKLNRETAFMEARNEIAMEGASKVINVPIDGETTVPLIDEEEDDATVSAQTEAEMQRIAAEELVRQMKAEIAAEAGVTTLEKSVGQDENVAEAAAPTQDAIETPKQEDEGKDEGRAYRGMLDGIDT